MFELIGFLVVAGVVAFIWFKKSEAKKAGTTWSVKDAAVTSGKWFAGLFKKGV